MTEKADKTVESSVLLNDFDKGLDAALGASTLSPNDAAYTAETPSGNDPRAELHYQQELDPMRLLPENGYPYLDHVQRAQGEVMRAAIENRDPDLDNPPPVAGTPLRSYAELNNPMNTYATGGALQHSKPAMVLDEDQLSDIEDPANTDPNNLTPKASNDVDKDGSKDTSEKDQADATRKAEADAKAAADDKKVAEKK